jgi:hypothetical protein
LKELIEAMSSRRSTAAKPETFQLLSENPFGVYAVEYSTETGCRGPGLWLPSGTVVRVPTPADRGGHPFRVPAFTNPYRGAECYLKIEDMYVTSDGRLVACYGCRTVPVL